MKSLAVGFERVLVYVKSSEGVLNPVYRPATDDRQNSGYWKGFHNSADRPTMRYELLGVQPEKGQWKWKESVAVQAVRNYQEYQDSHSGISLEEYWANTGKEKRFIRRRHHLTRGQNKGVEHWIPPSEGVLLSSNWPDILASERDLLPLGISFNAPKKVNLIKRIVEMCTDEDSTVLDSFAGSGTTAHAVLSLNKEDGGNRKFILVECEDYADSITAERVRRAMNGIPEAKDESLRKGFGGSFTYATLGDPIDVEGILTGESLPAYTEMAAYLLNTASGLSVREELKPQNENGLFYGHGDTDFYMLYRPEIKWLRSNEAILNERQARQIHGAGRNAVVFAVDKFMGQRFLSDMRITFCQIPYELHRLG